MTVFFFWGFKSLKYCFALYLMYVWFLKDEVASFSSYILVLLSWQQRGLAVRNFLDISQQHLPQEDFWGVSITGHLGKTCDLLICSPTCKCWGSGSATLVGSVWPLPCGLLILVCHDASVHSKLVLQLWFGVSKKVGETFCFRQLWNTNSCL